MRNRTARRTERDRYDDVAAIFELMAALEEDDPQRAVLREQLIERCLPLAEHIARRFHGRGEPVDDVLQAARIGLIQAINRFDVAWGSHFFRSLFPPSSERYVGTFATPAGRSMCRAGYKNCTACSTGPRPTLRKSWAVPRR